MIASVIVPTYNKEPRLKLLLTSIVIQNVNFDDFELIIVDDGSTDSTEECIYEFFSDINIRYYNIKNKGRAAARNIGVEKANGDIIIFSDDDLIWEPNFLQEHINMQINEPCILHGGINNLSRVKFFQDPSKGILFSDLKNNIGIKGTQDYCIVPDDIKNHFYQKIHKNARISSLEKMIQTVFSQNIYPLFWIGFTGGNLSCPAGWIREVNGFDEQFGKQWGFEDFELGYRLLQKGLPFQYSNETVNYHLTHYRATAKIEMQSTFKYFYQKYNDSCILDIYLFLNGEYSINDLLKKYLKEGVSNDI